MVTTVALAAYGALMALALLIASWWGINPWGEVTWSWASLAINARAVGWGALAATPLVALLMILDRWTPWPLVPLKESVEREVVPLLENASLGDFVLISVAAGFGEELFFRGLLQAGLTHELLQAEVPYAIPIGIAAASIIFGLCHWINREYALVAAIIGAYLGVLLVVTNNLLTPITTHALYDVIAMWYLVSFKRRWRKRRTIAV
jgi:membrane protease YdiL (CAAX protease family)